NFVLEEMQEAYIEPGLLVNSQQFNGMSSEDSKEEITKWMSSNNMAESTVNYRLRDWGVSRQRYWGNPIPIVYCDKCGTVLVPDEDLPIELPEDVQIGKTTQNPLLSATEWVNTTCPKCGSKAKRETDTMDTFVDSSWYFARYTDSKNKDLPFDKKSSEYWLPVDQYIGGIEHAVMHLMYARFFHKFMRDLGLVNSNEPFSRLLTQGMVTKDGAKMSKSKGNVVDPKEYIERYGADTVRTFMLFASPPEKDVEWSDKGVKGAFRFLNRVWRIFDDNLDLLQKENVDLFINSNDKISSEIKKLRFSTHDTIRKVNEDISERMQFNTAIAAVMEHLNNVYSIKNIEGLNYSEKYIFAESCTILPRLLYPFAPHISEELWEKVGNKNLIFEEGIVEFQKKYLVKDEITYVVQVKGKIRGKLHVSPSLLEDKIKEMAIELENVQKYIGDKKIRKVIVVPKKLVSIVI
ncbi:MAG: class I tRNA ligase family protein, partial [Candidatus Cloacimonadota bacterium]|nr:class I tRNA ligase family protein [Candidatus Cloacimonadota bacterium]